MILKVKHWKSLKAEEEKLNELEKKVDAFKDMMNASDEKDVYSFLIKAIGQVEKMIENVERCANEIKKG